MTRRDSMILTFAVPLLASGQGLCDIDRVRTYSENFRKIRKSWQSGIKPILSQMEKLE